VSISIWIQPIHQIHPLAAAESLAAGCPILAVPARVGIFGPFISTFLVDT
jgi:hypothetical protein